MAKKDFTVRCPKCGKAIGSYALLCPHCGVRIAQTDFGKSEKPAKLDESQTHSSNHQSPYSHGAGFMMVLVLLVVLSVISVRFSDEIKAYWDGKHNPQPRQIHFSSEDFGTICREGISRELAQDGLDVREARRILDEYARRHGYPNRAALLKQCGAKNF